MKKKNSKKENVTFSCIGSNEDKNVDPADSDFLHISLSDTATLQWTAHETLSYYPNRKHSYSAYDAIKERRLLRNSNKEVIKMC